MRSAREVLAQYWPPAEDLEVFEGLGTFLRGLRSARDVLAQNGIEVQGILGVLEPLNAPAKKPPPAEYLQSANKVCEALSTFLFAHLIFV